MNRILHVTGIGLLGFLLLTFCLEALLFAGSGKKKITVEESALMKKTKGRYYQPMVLKPLKTPEIEWRFDDDYNKFVSPNEKPSSSSGDPDTSDTYLGNTNTADSKGTSPDQTLQALDKQFEENMKQMTALQNSQKSQDSLTANQLYGDMMKQMMQQYHQAMKSALTVQKKANQQALQRELEIQKLESGEY